MVEVRPVDFDIQSTIYGNDAFEEQDYESNIKAQELRQEFFQGYRTNTSLPIAKQRSIIIKALNSYKVIVIEGNTGCGKTTQVPMYILEDAILQKKRKSAPIIYVTQPRRIAAKSIAQRVCDEHNWPLGSIVGYQVGLEKVVGEKGVLVYCTAGVLLQKLIADKSLKSYTHIVVDEVHERDADTDLLLMIIKTLMLREKSHFSLVVMSATMEAKKLAKYYTFQTDYGHRSIITPCVCKVQQDKPASYLQIFYLNTLKTSFQMNEALPELDMDTPGVSDESMKIAVHIIIDIIPNLDTFNEKTNSTLVFLPGLAEIEALQKLLKQAEDFLEIIPLHSCISSFEQARVFMPAMPGKRKVILATNIAESSITVKDAGFVIDFCLTKMIRKDDITGFPTLRMHWASADKCVQRAGRTGRCCPGKVFRLVTYEFFQRLPQYAEPELLTAPLETSVLKIKNFQMGVLHELLASVIDPPEFSHIRSAVLELKKIGALSCNYQGKMSSNDGDLTELGRVISILPIDVRLSKLIVMANALDVLDDAIIVAACLSTNKTVVKHLFGNLLETYEEKLRWSNGSYSDLFVSLDVYKEFINYKDLQCKSPEWLAQYCNNKHLDDKKLHEVSALIQELRSRLEAVNIQSYDQPNRERNHCEDALFLKVAFCAAFYPNYFITNDIDELDVERKLCGLDPLNTVILHSFPPNQVPLYRTQVLCQIQDRISDKIDYIADVSRAFLVFRGEEDMPEDVNTANAIKIDGLTHSTPIKKSVCMAIKLGQFNRVYIREFHEAAARERMRYYEAKRVELQEQMRHRLLPVCARILSDGQRADNSALIEDADLQTSHYDVELNLDQELDDLDLLEKLEIREESRRGNKAVASPIYKEHKLLFGPYSPIAIEFRAIEAKTKCYGVDVDPTSINSVLLNPEYHVPRRQMLVSALISHSKRNRVMARDTTLMPNIRGLPALMALLFAPYNRVLHNDKMKCLAGAVFGLGWNSDNRPLDRTSEVELEFDVQFTQDDIELINKARALLSKLIKLSDVTNPGAPLDIQRERLREVLLFLIRKKRYPLESISILDIDWEEEQFHWDQHNVPKSHETELQENEFREFLPPILMNKSLDEMYMYKAIRGNLDHLARIEQHQTKPPMGGIRCLLCGGGQGKLYLIYTQIVAHVDSCDHIKKLKVFEKYEERARTRAQNDHQVAVNDSVNG